MQGYIVSIKNIKDEDLIVEIVTPNQKYTTYRFYGVRHGTINVGFKIDFELETNLKSPFFRLKDVMHLGFGWIFDTTKLYNWQRFIGLLAHHLKEIETLEPFYFNILEECVIKINKQDEKRAIIEAYIKILAFEGRLHNDFVCLLCDQPIMQHIALVRGLIPAHPQCSYSESLLLQKVQELFRDKTTFHLNDQEVKYLWNIVLQGL